MKMNKQTIPKLRADAKEQGFAATTSFTRLTFLFTIRTINDEMLPRRANNHKRKSVHPIKVIQHQQKMKKIEEQQIAKSRPVAKKKQNDLCDQLVNHLSKTLKNKVGTEFKSFKSISMNPSEIISIRAKKLEITVITKASIGAQPTTTAISSIRYSIMPTTTAISSTRYSIMSS